MAYEKTIERLQREVVETFSRLDSFFDLPDDLRWVQPDKDEWSIDEILEHITLTNRFLMITLRQSLTKVLRRVQEQSVSDGESRLDRIAVISDPDAFGWIRPEHMEPTRVVSSAQVRQTLDEQKNECLNILSQINHGEGSMHRVRMSVQDLGKLDMYEWMYFLVQHACRHIIEMERICLANAPE